MMLSLYLLELTAAPASQNHPVLPVRDVGLTIGLYCSKDHGIQGDG